MRVVFQKGRKMFMLFMNSYFMNRPGVFSKIFEKKIKKKKKNPPKGGQLSCLRIFLFSINKNPLRYKQVNYYRQR